MFDIGFLELVVILVLALLVLGPERLPKAAKTVGYWFGKARRYVEGMKAQVESEFDTTEVKRLLRNQEVQIRELQGKIQDTVDVNQFIDDDDPGNGHQDVVDTDLVEANLVEPDLNKSEEQVKPAGSQYEMIEEDDDRWDELEDSNPSTISAEEQNEIDEKTDDVSDIESNIVETETSKTQSESAK